MGKYKLGISSCKLRGGFHMDQHQACAGLSCLFSWKSIQVQSTGPFEGYRRDDMTKQTRALAIWKMNISSQRYSTCVPEICVSLWPCKAIREPIHSGHRCPVAEVCVKHDLKSSASSFSYTGSSVTLSVTPLSPSLTNTQFSHWSSSTNARFHTWNIKTYACKWYLQSFILNIWKT